MIIGQVQVRLQLIPGFIRKSIETEIIDTQLSLETSRNSEQDTIFMIRWLIYSMFVFMTLYTSHFDHVLVVLIPNEETCPKLPIPEFVNN